MKIIEFTDAHRRKHFDFFKNMNHPHFGICAPVDITRLLPAIKTAGQPFMATVAWMVSQIANGMPEYRLRIRGEQVVEHDAVHPSFAVPTDISDVFSFCEVKYQPSYPAFVADAKQRIEHTRHNPSFEDEHGRDDYLFLSSMPWVSFTGVMHPMHYHPHDSVPRIVWGKFYEENGRIKMPLSVQAHHALVDGSHLGRFFQEMEKLCAELSWMAL
jgi:chloramphenicol O-acetyltransferase type A